jgi:hypothetical protein
MARLKIVRQDGSVIEGEITPAVEYFFEQHAKMGFHKAFRDEEKQSHVYWLAHGKSHADQVNLLSLSVWSLSKH